MEITPAGDSALIIRLCEESEADTPACSAAVLRACAALRSQQIAGVIEFAPAYHTIAVFYDPVRLPGAAGEKLENLSTEIRDLLQRRTRHVSAPVSRQIAVPVCYDPEFALDLAELQRHSGLTRPEVIRAFAGAEYRVQCVGFTPGFPYLAGLPTELFTPRRATPRTRVPAGSVAIGGGQAGIYPFASPGGWNVIGRTPLTLFSPTRAQPALFRAGDRVRFTEISRADFERACQ